MQKKAREMFVDGASVAEIAKELNVTVEAVRDLLQPGKHAEPARPPQPEAEPERETRSDDAVYLGNGGYARLVGDDCAIVGSLLQEPIDMTGGRERIP